MNILLKSFDGPYCKQIIEHAFQGRHIDTCFSILNNTEQKADLDAKKHIWIPATPLRSGEYNNVDWNEIKPLDAALIEKMGHCESVFLMMLERYAKHADIPYTERKRQYMQHLRYWNHFLDEEHIDLFLSNHVPHQCYDYVIYCLCKIKTITTLYLERCFVVDGFFVVEDLEKSSEELPQMIESVRTKYSNPEKTIPLSETFENSIQLILKERDAMGKGMRGENLLKKSFFLKWWSISLHMLINNPCLFFISICSPKFWERKWLQHNIYWLYNENSKIPDLSKPYIYFPLHFQPEATTCPMAGAFTNQELIIEMLAKYLPEDINIYVKEHPAQEEICRSKYFYETLLNIPSVTFVPRDFNSFQLIKHSLAVVTGTGTAGFEALFHEKPVLMFGHRFFQYAPGVFRIRTNQDCKRAIQSVLAGNSTPTMRGMRLFIKAVERCTKPFPGGPVSPRPLYTKEEKAIIMGKEIGKKLYTYFT